MSDNQPLFQDTDATERENAPEQIPGSDANDALEGTPVPVVPVRGDLSQNQLIPLPAAVGDDTLSKGGDAAQPKDAY